MFDSETAAIIKNVPELHDLDRERLPEYLSEIYTKIIDLRVKILNPNFKIDQKDIEELQRIKRLSSTYSVLALNIKSKDEKKAAAFVAGSVFQLLSIAAASGIYEFEKNTKFTNNYIPPAIVASLLFVIAEQPADAFETASKIKYDDESQSILDILSHALFYLIQGKLTAIKRLPDPEIDILSEDVTFYTYENYAYDILWGKILVAIEKLAQDLLKPEIEKSTWSEDLKEVLSLSVSSRRIAEIDSIFFHDFAAPYHLAMLLLNAGNVLMEKAVINIPIPPDTDSGGWNKYIQAIAKKRPYLWKNHYTAIEKGFLNPGKSAVITYPTGAGKSALTEMKIVTALLRNKKVVFLTVTRALVDQVERDLRDSLCPVFGNDIVAGFLIEEAFFADITETKSRISVMTPERCLTLIGIEPDMFTDVGLIVFDECHILHSEEGDISRRGLDSMLTLIKLSMIPERPPEIVLLSAMIENGDELAKWITAKFDIECLSLDMRWKPTRQMKGCVIYDEESIKKMEEIIWIQRKKAQTKLPPASLKRKMTTIPYGLFCLRQTWNTMNKEDYSIIQLLNKEITLSINKGWDLTSNRNKVATEIAVNLVKMGIKTLIFGFTRPNSESIAREASRQLSDKFKVEYNPDELRLLNIIKEEIGETKDIYELIDNKTGCHHGFLLPFERRLIESVFKRTDGIKILSSTPTLAQGMNLPAEAVILAGDDRFEQKKDNIELCKAHEILNASGRAGRAGWKATGMVILIPGKVIRIGPSKLDRHWFTLQELIFSKEDQCIKLIDPIDRCLDALQSTIEKNNPLDPILDYFIYRLPQGDYEDSNSKTAIFFNRSLGAFIAEQKQLKQEFDLKVKCAIQEQKKQPIPEETASWETELSAEIGIPVELINKISSFIDTIDLNKSIIEWVNHLNSWIIDDKIRLKQLFEERDLKELLKILKKRHGKKQIFIETFFEEIVHLLTMWMQGLPLKEIENYLDPKSKKCRLSREFVIRLMPKISFVFGLFPLIYRKKNQDNGQIVVELPAAFGSLAACIREGFDNPYKLALYYIKKEKRELMSRRLIHKEYLKIKDKIEESDSFESFYTIKNKIAEVC